MQFRDCNGTCFGTATIDDCGYCTDSLSFNSHLDCTGVCNGPFSADSCGICQLPDHETGQVTEHVDCNGQCMGGALLDACRICYGGTTGKSANSTMDACGVCNGDNSTCYGCDNVLNSGQVVDSCGHCGSNDCGCFHMTSVSPESGPRNGSTVLTIKGAGFFKNGSNYNVSLPYCGGAIEDSQGIALTMRCHFSIVNNVETIISSAYAIDQSTIVCTTPKLASQEIAQRETFNVRVQIDNKQSPNTVLYYYENYTVISVTDTTPKEGLFNQPTVINYSGKNFFNSSSAACLLYQYGSCIGDSISDPYPVPAHFYNTTSISCTLPISNAPCQITVKLSLDGQESGVISTSLFNYSFSSPVVQSVHFSDNLTSLVISLDRSSTLTDNRSMSCDAIFSSHTLASVGGTSAICFWSNSLQNSILVSLPESATVSVSSPIIFNDGIIATQGTQFSLKIHNTVVLVSNVTNAIKPTIVLTGPTLIPTCGNVIFTAYNSIYEGYKSFHYSWSIHTNNATISGFLADMLNKLHSTNSEISIPSNLFLPSVMYVLRLQITNALGLSSIETRSLIKPSSTAIEVAIIAPNELNMKPDEKILIEGHITNSQCTAPSGPYIFQWLLYKVTDLQQYTLELTALPDIITTNPLLYIPPNVLKPSSLYKLSLTVTANGLQGTNSINVTVSSSRCTPYIHGGNRNISTNGIILLNASNTQSTSYVWACSIVSSGLPCYNATVSLKVPILLPRKPILLIPGAHLQPGLFYNFTLISEQCPPVSSIIGITSLTTTAVVQILTRSLSHVTISKPLTLEGLVYSDQPVSAQWSCVNITGQAYIDLNDGNHTLSPNYQGTLSTGTISNLYQFQSGLTVGRASRANLILKPNSLLPGWKYTFQLTVNSTAFSQVTFTAASPPVVHKINIVPLSGLALSTQFDILVNRTIDNINDLPLYYCIGLMKDQSIYWLTSVSSVNLVQLILPSGDLTLLVKAYDKFLQEFSHTQIQLSVSTNPSINYLLYIQNLHATLTNSKEWQRVLSDLVSVLLSIDSLSNSELANSVIALYSDILNNYVPHLAKYHSLILTTTMELITQKLATSTVNKLVNELNTILDVLLDAVTDNFISTEFGSSLDSSGHPLLLTSDRFNRPPIYSVQYTEIGIIVNIMSNIFFNADSSQFCSILTKLSTLLCKQVLMGQPAVNVSTNFIKFLFIKTMPFDTFYMDNEAAIDLLNSLEQIYNEQCLIHSNVACPEMCIQFGYTTSDYLTDNNQLIEFVSQSQSLITSTIRGVDPLNTKLHSNVIHIHLSTATTGNLAIKDLPLPIHVYIAARPILDEGSQPICVFRDVSSNNNKWKLITTSPPVEVTINGLRYYRCEYDNFGEFAVALLPPPIIVTSSPLIESSSILPMLMSSVASSEFMSPSPTVVVSPYYDPGPAVGSIVPIVILIIVTVIIAIIGFVIWRKKRVNKMKVAAVTDEETDVQPLEKKETQQDEATTAPGVTFGVIQLLPDGERFVLGSVNVLHTMRLRELRTQIIETFSVLKNKPFYLCTKELCDIDPATEQQQFVSIVYSNIIYIREVSLGSSDKTKRQFCICGSIAQFECTGCNYRGYCSHECQQKHWSEGHRQECERISEKRNRTDILLRQQLSTTKLPTVLEEEEEKQQQQQQRPSTWKGFLSESKRFSNTSLPTAGSLPPLAATTQTLNQSQQYRDLRKQIESTVSVESGVSQSSLKPPALPRLLSTGQLSVGKPASNVPTMPSIRSVPLVPLSATSQTYTGMRSPPPILRPPSLVTPLVQPGAILTRQPTIDQLNQSFGSQQYVQSTLMSPVLQPVQYNSPFVWPSVPHTTASQSGLRRDMSISSVGSVDLNLSTASYAVPKRTLQVNNPPETVHEDDNESSTSESD